MSAKDATETAVEKIASRGMEDAPGWAHDLFDLVMAVDKDANARHESEVKMAKAVAVAHDARLAKVEAWQRKSEADCPAKLQGALDGLRHDLDDSHLIFHTAHMNEHHAPRRTGDPPQADWTDRRGSAEEHGGGGEDERRKVWVMWGIGERLAIILTATASAVASALLTHWLMQ